MDEVKNATGHGKHISGKKAEEEGRRRGGEQVVWGVGKWGKDKRKKRAER